jgi:hypothetical protein
MYSRPRGLGPREATGGEARLNRGEGPLNRGEGPAGAPDTVELVRSYYKIREPVVRTRLLEMVKAVGAASHAGELRSTRK